MASSGRKPPGPVDTELFGMLHELLSGRHPAERFGSPGWMPQADVLVTTGKAWVRIELPGVAPEDLRLQIRGRSVELSGVRRSPRREPSADYLRAEIVSGSFYRRLDLPWEIDADRVEHRHEYGVLELHLTRVSEPSSGRGSKG